MASRDDRQELTKKVQYTMDAVSVLKSQVARLVCDFVVTILTSTIPH